MAEHVLSPSLWKPEDAALEIAEQMFALMNDDVSLNEVGRSICAETFRTTKVKLIRLLGELDAHPLGLSSCSPKLRALAVFV